MATFFANQPVVEQDPYAAAKSGYEFGYAMRDAERKKKFEQAFAESIDAHGNVDQAGFYTKAKGLGLSPDQIREVMKYRQDQLGLQSKIAQDQTTQRALGYVPESAGRNNAQYGDTQNTSIIPGAMKVSSPSLDGAGAPLGPSSIDPDKLRNPSEVGNATSGPSTVAAPSGMQQITPVTTNKKLDDWFNQLKTMSKKDVQAVQRDIGLTGKDVDGKPGKLTKAALEQHFRRTASVHGAENIGFDRTGLTAQQGDYADEAGGQVSVGADQTGPTGGTFTLPPDNVGPDVFAPAPEDRRTFDQTFEDSYRRENSLAGQAGNLTGAGSASELTKWEPKNDGSNAFRQYSAALQSKLRSAGFADASSYLDQIYKETIKANMPALPNEGLLAMGVEGQAKYRGELNNYMAALEKAKGLAGGKVMEARQALAADARQYGVDTQAHEKHEADLGGRRAGGIEGSGGISRYRAVSETEKTRGDLIANAYQDLIAAKNTGGFEGDYAAAVAKARADNNMNANGVVDNLISMGAFPSEKSAYIKKMMSEAPVSAWDAITKKVMAELGGNFYTDTALRDKWYKNAVGNMEQAARLVGYSVNGEPPKSGAQRQLESKAKKPAYTPPARGNLKGMVF